MCSRICKHNYRITIIVKIGYRDHSPAGLVVTGVPLARDDMHSPRATVKHTPCISLLESVQRAFTKHIQGMHTYSYADRLSMLKLYSLQRRRDRYTIIYVWKILESIVPNLNIPITCYSSIRRGRLCATSHVRIGHLGSVLVLVYTQEGSLWSIVLRCDDHTGIFTCDGCARDPYFYVPAETQSYVIKLSCSRKVLAASGD